MEPLKSNAGIENEGSSSFLIRVKDGIATGVELTIVTKGEDHNAVDLAVFSDNCLDLVPGYEQIVTVRLKEGRKAPKGGWKLRVRYLGSPFSSYG
jgi:beta-mannosidase